MVRYSRFRDSVVIPLACCLGISGCGSGGGVPDMSTPHPEPVITPEPPDCLQTAAFGCLDPDEYRQRRAILAQDFRSREDFGNQWGLSVIRADLAYAELALRYGNIAAPGHGQTVGLIDSGIDRHNPVFAGKTVYEEFWAGATDNPGDRHSHGTAVASVVAGNPSTSHTNQVQAAHGVARGADIAMFAVPTGSGGGGVYRPINLQVLNSIDETEASGFNTVTNWSRDGRRLDFVNMSIGYTGLIEQYEPQDLRRNFGRTISALAQTGRSEKTIFIVAAGNANGTPCDAGDFAADPHLCRNGRVDARSPGILAGFPARLPELRGHMVAVAAVVPDTDGDGVHEIASFSNRCGIAAEWCLAAPGGGVRLAYFGPHPGSGEIGVRGAYDGDGTSYAAPMVTGSLVVMKHAFRNQLSNTDLLTRLLVTANNRGVYANRDLFGRGLLDLGAALAPVGAVSVALGDRVGHSDVALAETIFRPGGALGNGLAHGLSGQEFAVFDTLAAPFWLTLDNVVGQTGRPSSGARLRDFMAIDAGSETTGFLRPGIAMLRMDEGIGDNGWYVGQLRNSVPGGGGGHLSLTDRALTLGLRQSSELSIAAFSTEGSHARAPASGTTLTWQSQTLPFRFRSGLVEERRTLLGSQVSGAFGSASARSMFIGVDWRGQIERWRLHVEAEIGRADGAVGGGMIEDVSPLVSSAFAVHANRPFGKGTFSVSLLQPLRVESGKVRLLVPAGRTTDGRVLHRPVSVALAPDGRQIDVVARWARSFGDGHVLRLGAIWSRHPGHDAAATPTTTVMANWRVEF